jgi:hypothetical protein
MPGRSSSATARTTQRSRAAWRRTGRLLALLQRLGSRDAHYANVLFSGERPCLVDCEALLQPRLRVGTGQADWHAGLVERCLALSRAVSRCLALSAGAPAWQYYLEAAEREPRAALARCAEAFLRHRLELLDGRLAWFGVGAAESGAALLPRLAGLRWNAVSTGLHRALHAAARLLADPTLAECARRMAAQWPASGGRARAEEAPQAAREPLAMVLERRRAATPYFDPVGEHGDLAVLGALCRASGDARA